MVYVLGGGKFCNSGFVPLGFIFYPCTSLPSAAFLLFAKLFSVIAISPFSVYNYG